VARKKAIIKRQVNTFELLKILVLDFFAFHCNRHGPKNKAIQSSLYQIKGEFIKP
jgi:hypothetical protein